jgi:phage terminase small subunit|tara:strand:+ start:1089 stop:1514 length:426 start_codon:yes stop_codon:yes gene_type:complete
MAKLTAKQELFCKEYIVDLNAAQAAIRAGYSSNTAKEIGCENLTKPNIAEFIAELKQIRNEKVEIDAEWVLRQAVKVHERCMQAEPVIDKEGGSTGEYKFEHSGANKALEIIGKHVSVQAFLEKKEIAAVVTHEQWLNGLE